MFFTKTKRERDEAREIAERQAEEIKELRSDVRAAEYAADRLTAELQQSRRKADILGEALNEVLAERDALRPDAEQYRANLARLAAANAARKAAAQSKRAH
ncbi:uncharacterized coiled-coil DUF342 family protein [Sphingomonas trueperi]|uniref:hypothetical protein n=1 Tax=Sphingomonas trueperi TaxID=53317 RepID=UPI0033974A82